MYSIWIATLVKDLRWKIDANSHIVQFIHSFFSFFSFVYLGHASLIFCCLLYVPCSVTIVVAYLMRKHGMSLSQALEFVKSKRPVAAPNRGFISQLQEFEKSLLGTQLFYHFCSCLISAHIDQRDIISTVWNGFYSFENQIGV